MMALRSMDRRAERGGAVSVSEGGNVCGRMDGCRSFLVEDYRRRVWSRCMSARDSVVDACNDDDDDDVDDVQRQKRCDGRRANVAPWTVSSMLGKQTLPELPLWA